MHKNADTTDIDSIGTALPETLSLTWFFLTKIEFLTSHDRELVKNFPFMYHLLM